MIKKLSVSFLLLVSGTIPYILWQQNIAFLSPFSSLLPEQLSPPEGIAGRFLLWHASDMLWAAALLLTQDALIGFSWRNPLVHIGFSTPIILEYLQTTGIVPGRFDTADLAVYVIVISTYIVYQTCKRTANSKP